MAPKQDPKPKFQEGNALPVSRFAGFVASAGAGTAGHDHDVS